VLSDKIASVYLVEKDIYILSLKTASPGNLHCANCIGTLSFPVESFSSSMDRPSLDARRSGRSSSISSGGSGGGGGGGPVYSGCFAGKLTPTLGRRCVRLLVRWIVVCAQHHSLSLRISCCCCRPQWNANADPLSTV